MDAKIVELWSAAKDAAFYLGDSYIGTPTVHKFSDQRLHIEAQDDNRRVHVYEKRVFGLRRVLVFDCAIENVSCPCLHKFVEGRWSEYLCDKISPRSGAARLRILARPALRRSGVSLRMAERR